LGFASLTPTLASADVERFAAFSREHCSGIFVSDDLASRSRIVHHAAALRQEGKK
jgi:hypothetical protein